MSSWQLGKIGVLASVLLGGCGVHHGPPGQAVFRIEVQQGVPNLVPPSLPGGLLAKPIPFSQILASQYGFNPWEQYVDLSQGMRLAVQRMNGKAQTTNSYYGIGSAGRRGFRAQSLTPDGDTFDKHAKHMRLFYQTKFLKSPGQPVRPAVFLWSDAVARLDSRTVEARENPAFSCDSSMRDCVGFPGATTVSPEVQILVNEKPRYVLLGSTVRDFLRSDRVSDTADLRLLRKYGAHLVPVVWQQRADVMTLPLVAGDALSW